MLILYNNLMLSSDMRPNVAFYFCPIGTVLDRARESGLFSTFVPLMLGQTAFPLVRAVATVAYVQI